MWFQLTGDAFYFAFHLFEYDFNLLMCAYKVFSPIRLYDRKFCIFKKYIYIYIYILKIVSVFLIMSMKITS